MPSSVDLFAADFFNEHSLPDGYEDAIKSGLRSLQQERRPRSRSGTLMRKCAAGLSIEGLNQLERIAEQVHYPPGSILITEGRAPVRTMLLLDGEVSVTTTSRNGRQLSFGMARPGEVIGLESAILGDASQIRAEARSSCSVASFRRLDFLAFILRNPDACNGVARELADSYARVLKLLAQQQHTRPRWAQA